MDVAAIRGKTLTFIGEWVSSSVMLLFEPSQFIPTAETAGHPQALRNSYFDSHGLPQIYAPAQATLKGAARTSTVRKHIGFAASAVFVAMLIFQLVADRSPTGVTWNSVKESLPFSLLILGTWLLWSIILALVLKAFGGTQAPITNIVFGIRALATFYVLAVVIGTVAFLALGNKWAIFQWTDLLVSFCLFIVYFPLIFCTANSLKGGRLLSAAAVVAAIAVFRALLDFGATTNNPWNPPFESVPPKCVDCALNQCAVLANACVRAECLRNVPGSVRAGVHAEQLSDMVRDADTACGARSPVQAARNFLDRYFYVQSSVGQAAGENLESLYGDEVTVDGRIMSRKDLVALEREYFRDVMNLMFKIDPGTVFVYCDPVGWMCTATGEIDATFRRAGDLMTLHRSFILRFAGVTTNPRVVSEDYTPKGL